MRSKTIVFVLVFVIFLMQLLYYDKKFYSKLQSLPSKASENNLFFSHNEFVRMRFMERRELLKKRCQSLEESKFKSELYFTKMVLYNEKRKFISCAAPKVRN